MALKIIPTVVDRHYDSTLYVIGLETVQGGHKPTRIFLRALKASFIIIVC